MELDKVKDWYDNAFATYGIDSKSVGWKDRASQYLRFSKLLQVVSKDDRVCGGGAISINELGCGYGALYGFMKEKGMCLKQYFGYDISQVMIDAAHEFIGNHEEKDCKIFLENSNRITHEADYSVTSGIFNTIFDKQESDWKDYILEVLHNMNEKSTKGFSFNMLTDVMDFRDKNLYYANPCYYFEICRKYFSKKVALLHDYPLFEWTILVLK